MKPLMKNESGYTLLMVLLIIVVVGLMAPVLASAVMNSTLQNNKSEVLIQSENLIDMGKHYFRNEINSKIGEIGGETSLSLGDIKDKLSTVDETEPLVLPSESNKLSYQVGYSSITEENGYYIIKYTSRAIVDNQVFEEEEVFQIKNSSNKDNSNPDTDPDPSPDPNPNPDLPVPPTENEGLSCLLNKKKNGTITLKAKDHCILKGSFVINEHIDIKAQAKLEVYGSIVINGTVDLKGSPKGYLLIEGSGVFNNSIDIGGSNEILVNGAADFHNNVSLKGNGLIDIQGDAMFIKKPNKKGNGSIKINNREYN
ncbi:type II secretion system protein [Sutcliffiella horikoshii]|uniref:Type II secretion system protein n=1 Tax=Sutcliffiella horikoshii TaxID=79883 RepID=A0AA94WR36_9BACI|nr:type II secretion system protein [Sutcliffiella horikoshii]TYS59100.1 type II secretion system protein [Sutcliffiella horikoshii]